MTAGPTGACSAPTWPPRHSTHPHPHQPGHPVPPACSRSPSRSRPSTVISARALHARRGRAAGSARVRDAAAWTTPQRGAITDEYLRAMKVLWTEDEPSFYGAHVRFSDIVFEPKCVQAPHVPIWVAGGSGRGPIAALARAGRRLDADGRWHWTASCATRSPASRSRPPGAGAIPRRSRSATRSGSARRTRRSRASARASTSTIPPRSAPTDRRRRSRRRSPTSRTPGSPSWRSTSRASPPSEVMEQLDWFGRRGHAARLIEVQRDDSSLAATVQADELGRFRAELAKGGRIRLRVRREPPTPLVETSWIGSGDKPSTPTRTPVVLSSGNAALLIR